MALEATEADDGRSEEADEAAAARPGESGATVARKGSGTGFSAWLQRVRRTGEYSDVTVLVEAQDFRLHMLPLLNASSYFRRTASSGSTSTISLPDLPGGAEGFAGAADYCYLIKPGYTMQNVARIRAAAEYLGMDEVVESTKRYLYTNVFAHWRASVAFLQQYKPLGVAVDEYIETRCLKVLVAALARAFSGTKHLSAPMALGGLQSAPCQALSEILARTASLPDAFAAEALDALVEADFNLHAKCRQGRSVRSWLDAVVVDGCATDRARCWLVLCLARMLTRAAPESRPWLELSSQYWCSLLEHLERLVSSLDDDEDMQEKLLDVKRVMERRIGLGLDELDEYLHEYKFGPETLLAIVGCYVDEAQPDPNDGSFEEIVRDVDRFLWSYAEAGSISPETFAELVKAFPSSARQSHDTVFRAVEKLMTTREGITADEKQGLWRLVDHAKLSPAVNEKALNNPGYLSQPHILEMVLQKHSEELAMVPETDGQNMRTIMQKVINASLKLLEENSRRSQEIEELQQKYSALVGGKVCHLEDSYDNSPSPYWRPSLTITNRTRSETEGSEYSETPSMATLSSIEPRLNLRDIYALD